MEEIGIFKTVLNLCLIFLQNSSDNQSSAKVFASYVYDPITLPMAILSPLGSPSKPHNSVSVNINVSERTRSSTVVKLSHGVDDQSSKPLVDHPFDVDASLKTDSLTGTVSHPQTFTTANTVTAPTPPYTTTSTSNTKAIATSGRIPSTANNTCSDANSLSLDNFSKLEPSDSFILGNVSKAEVASFTLSNLSKSEVGATAGSFLSSLLLF